MSSSLQLFLLPLLAVANAYRLGAPIESCASIYPVGHNAVVHNSTATPNVDLNISGFTNGSYIPGKVYTRKPRLIVRTCTAVPACTIVDTYKTNRGTPAHDSFFFCRFHLGKYHRQCLITRYCMFISFERKTRLSACLNCRSRAARALATTLPIASVILSYRYNLASCSFFFFSSSSNSFCENCLPF